MQTERWQQHEASSNATKGGSQRIDAVECANGAGDVPLIDYVLAAEERQRAAHEERRGKNHEPD